MRWTGGSNRAGQVPVTIRSVGMTNALFVNQKSNHATWVPLGRYQFKKGLDPETSRVMISTTGTTGYVIADAVRFVSTDGSNVDNAEVNLKNRNYSDRVSFSPSLLDWTSSAGVPGFWGPNYNYSASSAARSVSFRPDFDETGSYRVFLRWTAGSNRVTNALVEIAHQNGVEKLRVNQQTNGGEWVPLGAYDFQAGSAGTVTLKNEGCAPTQFLIADAVRFEKI
jgi:hypothetical protein